MGLCTYCASLPIELFDRSGREVFTVSHQPSYNSLVESATAGCKFCELLLDAIRRNFLGNFSPLTRKPQSEAFSLRSDVAGQYIDVGSRMMGIVDGRRIPDEFESDKPSHGENDEFETIQRWLGVCQKEHKACKGVSRIAYVPTRLVKVDVESEDQVQLVQMKNKKPFDTRYLALSHCWGLNMPQRALTEVANLSERLRRINLSDLPLTFRDAINIARQLKISYVWIDSMCIIQDSKEDWEKEAADMTSVYSEAFLTIVATSSTNSSEGCRTDPGSIPIGPVVLQFPGSGQSHPASIQKVQIFPNDGYLYNFRSQPINQRGWTLQERELSLRVLFYTKETIRWECSCLKASLRYPWDDRKSFYTEVFNQGDARWRDTYSSTSPKSKEEIEMMWQKMACKFMDRKLTFQSDVMPAISGMAKLVQKCTGDVYLAGLWKSTLLAGLLWESNWDMNYETVRPSEYLAPSWSWASIIGPIHYFNIVDSEYTIDDSDLGPVSRPKILEAETDPAGFDPFGRLKAGIIGLEGVLRIGQVRGPKESINVVTLEVFDDHKKAGDLVYDVFDDLPEEDVFEVTCLYFRPKQGTRRTSQPIGIALNLNSGWSGGVYRRVGLLFSIDASWFAGIEPRFIRIV